MKAFKITMPVAETEEIMFIDGSSVYSTADEKKRIIEVGRKIDNLVHMHAKLGAVLLAINEGEQVNVDEALKELEETITDGSKVVLVLISMMAKISEK